MTSEVLEDLVDVTDTRFPDFPAAACAEDDPEKFFPLPGFTYDLQVEEAKQVCRPCPERLRCLAWALERDERGVWGATTDGERRSIRRGKPMLTCRGCGQLFADPGRQGQPPVRCSKCRVRRYG